MTQANAQDRPTVLRRALPRKPVARPRIRLQLPELGGAWVVGFILFEVVCQLALLFPFATSLRVPLRSAPFLGSIVLLMLLPRRAFRDLHPSVRAGVCVVLIVCASLAHPHTNTALSAAATVAMYLAILAPLVWAGGLEIDQKWLKRAILCLWTFSTLSALVGVGQTLRPNWQWLQPNLSAVVQAHNDAGEGLKISLASGALVFRPMGLSDQPGGAAGAGMCCVVFGLALLVADRRNWMRAVVLGSMVLGLYCIYLSQVRSVLIMTAVCIVAFCVVMALRGEFSRMIRALAALAGVVLVATVWAVRVGGETVTGRLATLVEESPTMVYYRNRGFFLEYTLRVYVPTYPCGAGLGRWGMMNYYFGDPDDPNSEPLWAEIMWTGWVFDGGVPLTIAYTAAVLIAVWQARKIGVRRGGGDLGLWASVICAYNLGALAVTFNYSFFMGQGGLDFWLLNACLFAAARRAPTMRPLVAPRGFENFAPPRSLVMPQPGWNAPEART
ncbi:MAG: hypothetical protein ACREJC_15315 [Tepidisphaeraceae bacterium]